MQINLTGKSVVVTGAGRGIGAVIATRFAREGCRVLLVDNKAEGLRSHTQTLRSAGHAVESSICDVRSEASVARTIRLAIQKFKSVDILVNNAGIATSSTIEASALADWENVFATNTRGTFLFSRAVLPHMKRQRRGTILNAASFAAIIPSFAFAAYAASKAAVVSYTRVLAAEAGPWGITATAYAPGMVPTAMNNISRLPAGRRRAMLNTLTLRHWGDPNDVASLLIFLSSEYARYITGGLIDVSGGKFSVQFPHLAYDAAKRTL